ncbi:MAG: hypothetical protein V1721_08455 [Pseudomonadota bacterium]
MTKIMAKNPRKAHSEEADDSAITLARKSFDTLISLYKESRRPHAPDILRVSRDKKAPEAFNAAALIF